MKIENKLYCGLSLLNVDESRWYELLKNHLSETEDKSLKIIMTPNPEQIMLMRKNIKFRKCLMAADWLLPDGWGLVWAAKLKQRLTGVETVREVIKWGSQKNIKMLLIGGRYDGAMEGKIKIKINGFLTDIYYTQGYQNVCSPTQNETKEVKRLISDLSPDVVWVAFGAPKQEEWLVENKEWLLKNNVKIAMAVGGSFDFILGKIKRAPLSWQKVRLEWLWRLMQEPSRIKRQLVLPQFVLLKLMGKLK